MYTFYNYVIAMKVDIKEQKLFYQAFNFPLWKVANNVNKPENLGNYFIVCI